jgi:putative transposase
LQRSTYYYKPVEIDILTQELLNIIDEYYTLHPEFGTRTMCNYLKSIGYDVNRKRIQNLYKTLGIQAIYTKPRTTIINKQHEKYPYLLDRIQVVRKDQAWCTDITYIRMKRGFMYLVAIMDWYSRYILSWQLSPFLEADFCIEALKEALQISSCEIFNSDQGSQFTSKDFTKILKNNNITISMAGKGRCYDNIFIERFWRTLKHNWIYLNEFNSVTELKDGLNYWIKFYNNERVHQALAYATPYSIYNK